MSRELIERIDTLSRYHAMHDGRFSDIVKLLHDCKEALASREGDAIQQAAVPEWTVTAEEMPPEGIHIIGFSEAWVCEDFNPDGIRDCFRFGDGDDWSSARWHDEQDCHETQDGRTGGHGAPTHWRLRPSTVALLTTSHKERTE